MKFLTAIIGQRNFATPLKLRMNFGESLVAVGLDRNSVGRNSVLAYALTQVKTKIELRYKFIYKQCVSLRYIRAVA